MKKSLNILTGRCSSSFCSSGVLVAEQHRIMALHLPVLYSIVFLATVTFTIGIKHQDWFSVLSLLAMAVFSLNRMVFWRIVQKNPANRTSSEKRKDLIGVVIIAPLISLLVTVNTSGLLENTISIDQNLTAVAIFLVAVAGSFVLVPLPVASILVVLASAIPLIIVSILNIEASSGRVLIVVCLVTVLTVFLLANGFRSFARETMSKDRLIAKTENALRAKAAISRLAFEDSLTDLPNRRKFLSLLSAQSKLALESGEHFAVALLDIDHFKSVNDLYGHTGGDSILRQVAARLQKAMDGKGIVARLSGDEFAFIFTGIYNVMQADHAVNEIHDIMADHFTVGDVELSLSASIGVALFPSSETSVEAALSQADQALYHAKKTGRAKTGVFSIEMEEKNRKRSRVTQLLRNAVAADEINVFFQPIVNLADASYHSCEVLARWHPKELGPISPACFIEIAENNGFIEELTFNLLRKTAKAMSCWPQGVKVNFNLSASLLHDPLIGDKILTILDEHRFDPKRLEIEITETAIVDNIDLARKTLEQLKEVGIQIALDDFGTGYSNLEQLGDLPIDKLKIDKSFIDLIETNQKKYRLVKSIIAICDSLELECVGEGIETKEQLGILSDMGCHYGQGYYFSRPVSEEKIRSRLVLEDGLENAA